MTRHAHDGNRDAMEDAEARTAPDRVLTPAASNRALPPSGPLAALGDVLSDMGIGLVVADPGGAVENVSPLAELVCGWSADEARGQRLDDIVRLEPSATESAPLPGDEHRVERSVLLSRHGQRFAIEHGIAAERDGDGRITRLIVAFRDVAQQDLQNLRLARHATHDSLTGLLNRPAFAAAIESELATLRVTGMPFAVCQIDLDQFNLIYHACGQEAGDELLTLVAALLREDAGSNDLLARLGGDVFAILLRDGPLDRANPVAEDALRHLSSFHFTWEDTSFPISASIGLVSVGDGHHVVAEVLAAADAACTMAKKAGRNQVHACHLDDEEITRRQRETAWVARISANLRDGGVALFGQPIVPLHGNDDGLSFEVLLRKLDDSGRLESAGDVIQAAEHYGLMGTIDRWVVRQSLQHLGALPKADLARVRLCSINLSGVSLRDEEILEYIQCQLAAFRIPPGLVCFEITETAAIENLARARWLLDGLQAIGCTVALDDFGSGLASYGYLRDLPVNFLKIAGSFIDNIATHPLDRALVQSIAQIARVLGIATIAESVASQAALDIVREIGVDYAQGHFVGMPRPLAQLWPAKPTGKLR